MERRESGLESWAINPGLAGLTQAAYVSPAIVLFSAVNIPGLRVIPEGQGSPPALLPPSFTDSNLRLLIKCSGQSHVAAEMLTSWFSVLRELRI